MRKNYSFNKILLCLCFFVALGAQAQTFPTFTDITPSLTPAGTSNLFRGHAIWGDFDNDGYPEAIVFSTGDSWKLYGYYLENTAGTLSCGTFTDLGITAFGDNTNDWSNRWDWTFTWIDYNNDGYLDLLLTGRQGSELVGLGVAELYKNNGAAVNGTTVKRFELVQNTGIMGLHYYTEENFGRMSRIAVGDYDNDGYPDVIMTGITGPKDDLAYHLNLYKNNGGDGTFTLQTTPLNGTSNFTVTRGGYVIMADFDNDGWLDIISNGWDSNTIYKNNGDGTFSGYSGFDAGDFRTAEGDLGIGDLNGDGKLDILMTGRAFDRNQIEGYNQWIDNTAAFYLSNGTSGYDLFPQGNLTRLRKSAVELIDLNADGKLDIAIVGDAYDNNGYDNTSIYLNNGTNANGSQKYVQSQAGLINSVGGAITFADYDNDGYQDVMMIGKNGGSFKVYHNDGNLPLNTAPAAPAFLQSSYDEETGQWTFSWSAGSDTETPVQSLRYNVFVKLPGTDALRASADDEIFMNVPADIETGYLKQSRIHAALNTTSYTMNLPHESFEWGVQTIDGGRLSSIFASAQTVVLDDNLTKLKVPVVLQANAYTSNEAIYVRTNQPASVTVYNIDGLQVAAAENVTDKAVANFLTKGVYLVKIQAANANKIIKIIL